MRPADADGRRVERPANGGGNAGNPQGETPVKLARHAPGIGGGKHRRLAGETPGVHRGLAGEIGGESRGETPGVRGSKRRRNWRDWPGSSQLIFPT